MQVIASPIPKISMKHLDIYPELKKSYKDINIYLADSPSSHYKSFKIPKRTVGFREIAQPSKKLKKVQIELSSLLEKKIKIHECALAYRRGKSIKDNAIKHAKSRYILKLDIENFFNSITPKVLFSSLANQGYSLDKKNIFLLEQVLFWNKSRLSNGKLVLSVGAPSSPLVSNIVMYEFDELVNKSCLDEEIIYTRYADDLTFSTNSKNVLFRQVDKIRKILSELYNNAFYLNEKKTVFTSMAHNRHVTGLTISNEGNVSIGREKKRIISAMIHKFKYEQLEEFEIPTLKGRFSFSVFIEPDFEIKMINKYGIEIIREIKS